MNPPKVRSNLLNRILLSKLIEKNLYWICRNELHIVDECCIVSSYWRTTHYWYIVLYHTRVQYFCLCQKHYFSVAIGVIWNPIYLLYMFCQIFYGYRLLHFMVQTQILWMLDHEDSFLSLYLSPVIILFIYIKLINCIACNLILYSEKQYKSV